MECIIHISVKIQVNDMNEHNFKKLISKKKY